MQYRSIVSVFFVLCLIVATFFSDVVEGRTSALDNNHRNSNRPARSNFFLQRVKRRVRNTPKRRRRDDDDTYGSDAPRRVDASQNDDNNQFGSSSGNQGGDSFSQANDQY